MHNFGVFLKKTIILFLFLSLLSPVSFAVPSLSAKSAILINADTCEPVFEHNAHQRLGMASTTKIMTAIIAIENGKLDNTYTVPDAAIGVEGSSLYLKSGEKMTLKELVTGLMLQSANDAAEAIAIIVGGSVDGFVSMMNQKATELGLTKTHFCNPHGLFENEHYTTAYELAKITAYALKNDVFREICSSKSSKISGLDTSRVVVNHNKMLSMYSGVYGVKTGFTKATGRCLVTAAVRDGVNLVAVTLNAPSDWNDHRLLFDYGFSVLEHVTLAKEGDIVADLPIIGGELESVKVFVKNDTSVSLYKNRGSIIEKIELNRPKFAPIYSGDTVGRIVFFINGVEIASSPLCVPEYVGVKEYKNPFWKNLFR